VVKKLEKEKAMLLQVTKFYLIYHENFVEVFASQVLHLMQPLCTTTATSTTTSQSHLSAQLKLMLLCVQPLQLLLLSSYSCCCC